MSPGVSVAHYRVVSKIGEGGMGEVWRATDTKLNRDVAIKILPEAFAQDADRMARFTREAQVLALLNHPNIAAIYGVEERALVMELVDGSTLAERIAQGAMPVEEALAVAKQIAEALEYAHERGLVHRDLKPANVKITPEGRVKVLDFGLAKALAAESIPGSNADSPTLTMRATVAGVIPGTAAYMAPEQARGKPADRRSDIWAFGVVLHEMLTGERAFEGDTLADLIGAVVHKEPDLGRVPARLRRLIAKCLEKDPRERLQAIGDWKLLLEEAPAAAAAKQSRRGLGIAWGAAALQALALGAVSFVHFGEAPPDRPLVRFRVDLGADAVARPRITAAISPDGSRLAYAVRGPNGRQMIGTRRLDQGTATILSGTENGVDPFFSPDGQWIGFFADGKMKKISVQGGAPVALCEIGGEARGASWGEDGNIIFTDRQTSVGLSRVSDTGGVPRTLTKPQKGEYSHRWPQILPGGQMVLFTATALAGDWENGFIEVLSLKTGQWKTVQRGGYAGRYFSTSTRIGHLVYAHQGTLFGVAFDPNRAEVKGTPVPLLDDVAVGNNFGAGNLDFSRNGTFVYLPGDGSQGLPLMLLDSSGKGEPLAPPAIYNGASFSPDGKRIALASQGDIFVHDRERGRTTRLTTSRVNAFPVWTPDGKHIVFRDRSKYALEWIRYDGAGEPEKLLGEEGDNQITPYSFSPDGRNLAFTKASPERGLDVWVLPVDTSDPEHPKAGKAQLVVSTSANDTAPVISPDGKWIAYTSLESGRSEVYVRPFPPAAEGSAAGRSQVSVDGGMHPAWSRTAHELFFDTLDSHIMVAGYKVTGQSFEAEKPRIWSSVQIIFGGQAAWSFDLAPDGKHIAALVSPGALGDQTPSVHVNVLLNFFDEVRRRVLETR
jgi:serine/threonine-protein kinase